MLCVNPSETEADDGDENHLEIINGPRLTALTQSVTLRNLTSRLTSDPLYTSITAMVGSELEHSPFKTVSSAHQRPRRWRGVAGPGGRREVSRARQARLVVRWLLHQNRWFLFDKTPANRCTIHPHVDQQVGNQEKCIPSAEEWNGKNKRAEGDHFPLSCVSHLSNEHCDFFCFSPPLLAYWSKKARPPVKGKTLCHIWTVFYLFAF
ncbi:hypothetical protein DFP73DRAFT_548316 [Morchella snyderi]|nr:hypothetical protein DFP73DRAFT_548316 [Morchella snyderi]